MITYRQATQDDIVRIFGKKSQKSFRALIAERDGKPIGLGGIQYERGLPYAFCHICEGVSPLTVWRCSKVMIEYVKGHGVVSAVADPAKPASQRFLERLGFEPVTPELYKLWKHS